ncbi:Phenylalanine--tRNA ligase, mitochondrial [Golovinomyces cichoracearum]|uniref:Phenylalanine--tRNA ligase, mitochondrial n=1 Tax=Golovinomyces cichoracearum TaxID=62708 RepID=A0A420HVN1_9PEZI|nr:Phenylalanine--tRNA ligase, mitochondrial [Golovinomyces cichoracearum]
MIFSRNTTQPLVNKLKAVRCSGFVKAHYYCGQQIYNYSICSSSSIEVDGNSYATDSWTNVSPNILSLIPARLHRQPDHPISLTRSVIETCFPAPTFIYHNSLSPVVSTYQNFDVLGFPLDHPGRSKSDTYYINKSTVLRTHTSAHQVDLFRENKSRGYLISADVYRRDAIDRSHYPVFHQMEGARIWDRRDGDITSAVMRDIEMIPGNNMIVTDLNHSTYPTRNILQSNHKLEEVEAISAHLKRSLEYVFCEVFSRVKKAAVLPNSGYTDKPLKLRWVEASFPFTSPSWELEIFWQGEWLEVLGCGIVQQSILNQANVPHQVGWAFGIGLERIAMLLFGIPDIRIFWSQDPRFLDQFKGLSTNLHKLKRYTPFSKYPGTFKDMAFWIKDTPGSTSNELNAKTHENDVMQIVRDVAGNTVENVTRIDEFKHPITGRISWCYRVNYRSLEKTLSSFEANALHDAVKEELVRKLDVQLR